MRRCVSTLVLACLLNPVLSHAEDGKRLVARDVGAVLAWRLGPELLEETCRNLDPEGGEARARLLQEWLGKNATLIAAVDARVAEVVPLAYSAPANIDAVQAVRSQVRELLKEAMFEGKSAEESRAVCQAETDAASPRWTNSGMRHVNQSLAELHDWKLSRGGK